MEEDRQKMLIGHYKIQKGTEVYDRKPKLFKLQLSIYIYIKLQWRTALGLVANGWPKARGLWGFLVANWSQMINILLHEFRGQGYILGMTQDFHEKAFHEKERGKMLSLGDWRRRRELKGLLAGKHRKLVSIRTLVSVLSLTQGEKINLTHPFQSLLPLLYPSTSLPTLSSGVDCLVPGPPPQPGSAIVFPSLASHLFQCPCPGTLKPYCF